MLPVGEVTTIARGPGDDEFYESHIYREVLQPFGYRDCIMLLSLRTGGRLGFIHACRKDSEPRFSQREIDLFKLFSKHICRVMQVSELFDLRALQSESIEAALDGLAAAVFLVSRDLRVVHMNAAAERRIKKGNALRLVNQRLHLADPAAAEKPGIRSCRSNRRRPGVRARGAFDRHFGWKRWWRDGNNPSA